MRLALRMLSRGGLLALAIICLAARLAPVSAQTPEGFTPFEFALLGDPQIGYGQGGEYADAARFGQVVGAINAQQLPLAIIAGDLVQDRSLWQEWIFSGVVRRLQPRVLLVAGNHDVVDGGSLKDYRVRHGQDFYDTVINNVAFIVINSETARDTRVSAAEFELQWNFIQRSLEVHQRAGRTHILLVMHRPPFVHDEAEASSDANWPLETRERLLRLARQHGVQWILAGHLHSTADIRAKDGLRIIVGAGSARSFDRSPVGYHRFSVAQDGLRVQKVVVAPAPREPYSIPGLREWTPRLLDPSPRHWFLAIVYCAVGALALARSRRLRAPEPGSLNAPPGAQLWYGIALALFGFGLNMQLDLDELLREVGRIGAQLTGIYVVRHVITASTLIALAGAATFLLIRLHRRSRHDPATTAVLALLIAPGAWFFLSAVSHHDIGMVFNEAWWDILILASLAGIALCARSTRQTT